MARFYEDDATDKASRKTIGERYSTAIDSSDLTMRAGRCDLGLIVAAGLVPNSIGARLYRLLAKYDSVRADHQAADKAIAINAKASEQATAAHMRIIAKLNGLARTKVEFAQWVETQAARRQFARSSEEVRIIAGQVLDVLLRPHCHHCSGRGFSGGGHRGEQVFICRPVQRHWQTIIPDWARRSAATVRQLPIAKGG